MPQQGRRTKGKFLTEPQFFLRSDRRHRSLRVHLFCQTPSIWHHQDLKGTQIDTQYPDEEQLPSLLIMDDFGPNTKNLLSMWEKVKNTAMPDYFYYLVLIGFVSVIGLIVTKVIIDKKKRKDRINRIKARYAAKK